MQNQTFSNITDMACLSLEQAESQFTACIVLHCAKSLQEYTINDSLITPIAGLRISTGVP